MARLQGEEVHPGKWLGAKDLDYGSRAVCIKSAAFEEIGEDRERKAVLYFQNEDKGLVLNKTNDSLITAILRKENIEEWIGQWVELYTEKVTFKGQPHDAIRVRAVSGGVPEAMPDGWDEDDIPV